MGVFHESWSNVRHRFEERDLCCSAAALPQPYQTYPPPLADFVNHIEIHLMKCDQSTVEGH
jgi:hypothetical protein